MSNEWYYAKAGQREGPISFDNLKQLVQQGQIRPADHVWKQGMAAWAPASTIDGLCGVEPPPLPPPAAMMTRPNSSTLPALAFNKEGMTEWLRWIDAHKIVVCAVPLAVCFLIGGLLALIAQDSVWLLVALSIGSVPFWIFRSRTLQQNKRRKLLYGMWEPVNGQGIYFQFTKDGALVRGDGVATRYRWLADDKIELFMDDSTPTVTIDVLSMSDKELIVRADGQGGHFKKGMTITEAEAEAQAEANRQAAWGAAGAIASGAGAIAGGAAMLALGGLAILGKAAVGTMTEAILDPALGSSPSIGGPFSSGGTSSPSVASAPAATSLNADQPHQQGPPRLRAAALCGAIVVDDDGTLVTYKKKCEGCGHVDPGTTRMQIRRGVTSGSFRCTKCGTMQETKIQGT